MNPDELINGLRGLKEPIEIPADPPPFSWQPWLYGFLGVVVLVICLWLFIQFRKKQIILGPANRALSALTKLSRTNARIDSETFVMEVSAILRGYVEQALGVQALRLSTEEFLEQAAASDETIDKDHRKILKNFLSQCDLVKFARGEIDEPRRDDLIDSALKFVRETSRSEPTNSAS